MSDLALTNPNDGTETMAVLMNPSALNALVAFADMMAKSVVTVPDHLRGKSADCLAITMQAAQWKMNPFAVAQKTHLINGKLSYEAQLVIAVLQSTGAIVGAPIYEYQGEGDNMCCRVGAVLRGESEPRWTQWLRNGSVTVRNSPLWKTNPAQQLGYRQAVNWARQYAPGAILGVYTNDELEDLPQPTERYMGPVDQVQPSGPRRRSETAAAPPTAAATVDVETGEVICTGEPVSEPPTQQPLPAAPASAATSSGGAISGGQVAYLRNKLRAASIDEASVCDRFQVASIELLAPEQFATLKGELLAAA